MESRNELRIDARDDAGTRPRLPLVERRRRTILTDPSKQWIKTLATGTAVACGILLIAAALLLQRSPEPLEPAVDGLAKLTMLRNGLFIVCVVAAAVSFVLLHTHRIAGPARALANAIHGFCDNEFSQRCHVRRRDFLHDVSRGVARLSVKLRADRKRLGILLDRLESDLLAGDGERALRRVRQFRDEYALDAASRDRVPTPVLTSVDTNRSLSGAYVNNDWGV